MVADVSPWAILGSAVALCATALRLVPEVLKAKKGDIIIPKESLDAFELRLTNSRRQEIAEAKKEVVDRVHNLANKVAIHEGKIVENEVQIESIWREIERRKNTR